MNVDLIDFSDPASVARYDRLFEACPNAFIQQSTYWAEAIRELGPDEPIFLVAHEAGEDVAGLPLYLFVHEMGNVLTSVPQPGPMGGIFCRDEITPAVKELAYRNLLEAAVDVARRHDCLALTLLTNPFDDDLSLYETYLEPNFILENYTQSIPLDSIFDGDRISLHDYNSRSNLSRNLKKGNQAGFTVRPCDSLTRLRQWHEIHVQRHTEIGAAPLELRLFERLWSTLVPQGRAALLLVERGDEIASGCFFVYHKQVVDVFMLSMNTAFADQAPNYVNVDYSLHWARQLGIHAYNWQSSRDRQGGVYRFKKGWGSVERPYYFVTRLFCDPDRITQIGIAGISRYYPWHYVVPFGAFEQGFSARRFRKP